MKTLKNLFLIPGLLALGAACMPAYGQTASTEAVVYFSKEKSDISRDISNIELQRNKIDVLEHKYRDAMEANNALDAIAAKKDTRKEMADLKKYKSFLRADKMALLDGYDQALRDRKRNIRKDNCAVHSEKQTLDKNLKAGNDNAAEKNVANVSQYQKDLDKDVALLKEQRTARNNDIIAINERINKSNGQFVGVTNAESAVAMARNRMSR